MLPERSRLSSPKCDRETLEQILEAHPRLTREAIQAALALSFRSAIATLAEIWRNAIVFT